MKEESEKICKECYFENGRHSVLCSIGNTLIDNINTICFFLINDCLKTGADSMRILRNNVTYLGKSLGDWEIVVKKRK